MLTPEEESCNAEHEHSGAADIIWGDGSRRHRASPMLKMEVIVERKDGRHHEQESLNPCPK